MTESSLVDQHGRPLAFRRDTPPATKESFDTSTSFGYAPGYMANAMMQVDLSKLDVGDYRAMRAHPQVNASLSVLSFMIHQIDWEIECDDKKIVDQITENVQNIWTRLIRAMSQAFWAGYSPCVLEWENDPSGRWVVLNKIKDMPPEDCSIVWKEVPGGYRPPNSNIQPKIKIFDGIRKIGMPYEIPVEHCVHPDTPILCADMSWRRAGDLAVGDELIGFDESPDPVTGRRHYRTSRVEVANPIRKKSMQVSIQGREPIIATDDHPWLVYRPLERVRRVRSDSGGITRRRHVMQWVKTNELQPGDQLCHLVDPWTENRSYEAGWLAGMFDGEGHLSMGGEATHYSCGMSQRVGPVLDRAKEILAADGFNFTLTKSNPGKTNPLKHNHEVYTLRITGGRREIMRFLGTYRPVRWQEDYKKLYEGVWLRYNADLPGAPRGGSVDIVEVAAIEDVGVQDIMSLQTSTRTYIGGGFLMHNSFWYPCLMENGNWYGRKLLSAAFMPWYFSILLHLYQVRYLERFGEPTPIGRAPFDETFALPDGKKITGKEVMETLLMNLRSRGAVTLPSDRDTNLGNVNSQGKPPYLWDIEYLESQMRGADFERALGRLDEEISMAIFTPMLLMRAGDVGSHNLGVQHTTTWLWMVNAIVGDMKEYIDRYIIDRMKAYNFSQNAPVAKWKPRRLGKDSADTVRQIMVALIGAGMAKPSLDELGAALGMTVEQIKQVTEPPAPTDTRVRPENAKGSGEPAAAGDSAAGGAGKQPA